MGDWGLTLDRSFFDRPAHEVAPSLLGRVVVHGPVALRITETEAYGLPGQDPASHTYRGMTPRNAVMFGPPGHLYVYFTYGMHYCANLTCLPPGTGSGVLLRAGEIVAGLDVARERRGPDVKPRDLARGPARLAVAMGFDRAHNGQDCCNSSGNIRIYENAVVLPETVNEGPRTGVSAGADVPWRFWLDGDPTVSPYRPHVRKSRPSRG